MQREPLKEGYIHDWATGKVIDGRKPEEKVRQDYEHILFNDYDYAKEQMDIEVSIQRGEKHSKKNQNERADIVIYKTSDKNKREQNEDVLGIIETKRPTKKEGIKQLTSYMSATSAQWGVWTNDDAIEYLYRNPVTGEIKEGFVYQIPKNGETFENIGRIAKNNLKPASNLKLIFRRLLKTLYANTNISRREKLGNEMVRLIFCKIWDERYEPNALPQFRIDFKENPKEVARRIKKLFNEVKNELVSDGVFDKNEKINLEDKSIAYVVGELEQYSLSKTDKDVVGDAFEVFAESKLVGEKGEFFTPREIVKTAIQIIEPQPQQTVFDPACGSGGFLIYAIEHIWKIMEGSKKYKGLPNLEELKKANAQKYFFGIDKEIDLVKIAKAYMAIIGDGRGSIVQQNTLHTTEDFEGRARELFVEDEEFKQFDIILTNPPFGRSSKILEEDAKNFDLGHVWKRNGDVWEKTNKPKETEPQVLFIERCLQMLRGGGKLAIVLPETYFHAPNVRYVLNYLKKDNNIIAIIDLAHNSFRPYNNAKTLLLVLEKGKKQQDKIIMGVAEEIGHDHNGKPIYRYNKETHEFYDEIWDDTKIIRKELYEPAKKSNTNVFVVDTENIKNSVYVPRYYWNRRIEELRDEAESRGLKFVQIKDLIADGIIADFPGHGSPPGKYKGKGEIPYVRVADIVNWAIYKNPTALIPEHVYHKIKREGGVDLQEKDILFVRRGSYRIGSVALVSRFDTEVLLTREIHVFRVINEQNQYELNAFYLLYLFSHDLTQRQLYNKVLLDTTLPNIARRWEELYLPVAKDHKEREKIKRQIGEAFIQKWEGQEKIIKLSEEFGNLIT
ncbi:MAG: N-6 DNA methylase [Smithellaceae bacterium]|jgi:type I restriction enzyme M protein|nr:N-6 DNA methylase [Smithellaceae bacterium]